MNKTNSSQLTIHVNMIIIIMIIFLLLSSLILVFIDVIRNVNKNSFAFEEE